MASAALVSSAMVEFSTLAASAGSGPDMLAYLEARSLNRTATLALVADTWEAVDTKVFRPFRDGVVVAGTMHKVADDEAPVAQAILRHMWSEARRQWDLFAAPPPRPTPTAPGFPEWGRLVDAYNKVLLGGEPRTFPADELLGAEDVLARMHWEHTRDKLYTPVAIGEILSKRTFSALKVVNPLSARRSTGSAPHQIKLVDGALAVEEDRPMVPKGIWSVVDGLTAIKWAWILIQLGTEKAIVAYVDWWIGKARLRSHQLDAVVDYWDAASHRLASEMRLGRTFDEVSRDITGDNLAFSEAMLASRQPAKKNHAPPANEDYHGEPDDQPKGKAKGKGARRRPGKRQRTTTGRDGRDQDWEEWPNRRWTKDDRWNRDDRDDDNRRGGRYQQTGRNDEDRRGQRQWRGQQQWRGQGNDRGEEGDGGPAAPGATLAVRPALRRRRRRLDYIVLSLFDGIGAAPALLEDLYGEPIAAFSWEVDRLCVKLASARLPWMTNRGDLTADSAQAVAAAIEKADPQARATVIVAAAPPCQDFSRIGSTAGHAGDRGGLFLKSVDFVHDVKGLIGDRSLGFLFENVVMEPKDAAVVTEALGVEPFVACASDFGWISRPRLWWMSPAVTAMTVDPAAGRQLQWGKHGSFRRLRLESPRAPAADMEVDGLTFHEAVTSGRLRLPCATTPAEDEQGRPAPKRVRQKLPEPAKARWAADGRRFAPWHYVEEAMMHDAAGRLHIIPPAAKEKLHMIPPGYTAADFLDDRARHKMLANGWHWGVARRLLAMLVVLTAAGPAQAAPAPEPRRSTMQWMVEQFGGGPVCMEPPPRLRPDLELPDDDPELHWRLAGQLTHCTVARRPCLEPALERVLELWTHWRHEVTRLRREVLDELAQMVLDMQDTTEARHTQIPVVLHLLKMVGYPDVAGITTDLTDGFDMLGELRRGPGWKQRTDGRYANPATGEYTEKLLAELVEEARLGRVVGPTRPPAGWNISTVPLFDVAGADRLVPPPPGRHFAAASFPIIQEDENGATKFRRGEDWRRAGHNATVQAHDVPTHHFVDDYVDIIRRVVELVGPEQAEALRIFGHDLLNAYRQWPVKEPAHSGTFLPAPNGVTMWFHMAMCFGAAASVWNFNRTADALQALKRVLLWIVSGHYVDDFNGVDLDELAPGAFDGMAEFLDQLGLQTKPSKAQKPATEHIVQGVLVSITRTGVVLQPTPARLQKVLTTIDTALAEDELAPDVASRLAGRLNFVTQSTFGAVGKAALQPVYSRAHDAAAASDTRLSMGLRAALLSLRHLLANIQPKVVPYVDDGMPQAIIYADAFYKPGEVRHKAGHIPAEVAVKPGTRGQNGWGFVVRIGGDVYYDYGVAPAEFLHVFAARKAFIYVLEILAQVLALVTMGRRLPQRWLAFIDNVAGQWALTKGYGKDPAVNGILASFWATASLSDWLPDFRRVPSKANVADAISRGDLSAAHRYGWTRVQSPVASILRTLARAAEDLEFAVNGAADELVNLAA
ncbi:unnamed protein product [Symbiodinium sp. KB8]|nr:unnamed protein product [Symbiodinium sp. KB8]